MAQGIKMDFSTTGNLILYSYLSKRNLRVKINQTNFFSKVRNNSSHCFRTISVSPVFCKYTVTNDTIIIILVDDAGMLLVHETPAITSTKVKTH